MKKPRPSTKAAAKVKTETKVQPLPTSNVNIFEVYLGGWQSWRSSPDCSIVVSPNRAVITQTIRKETETVRLVTNFDLRQIPAWSVSK